METGRSVPGMEAINTGDNRLRERILLRVCIDRWYEIPELRTCNWKQSPYGLGNLINRNVFSQSYYEPQVFITNSGSVYALSVGLWHKSTYF